MDICPGCGAVEGREHDPGCVIPVTGNRACCGTPMGFGDHDPTCPEWGDTSPSAYEPATDPIWADTAANHLRALPRERHERLRKVLTFGR